MIFEPNRVKRVAGNDLVPHSINLLRLSVTANERKKLRHDVVKKSREKSRKSPGTVSNR